MVVVVQVAPEEIGEQEVVLEAMEFVLLWVLVGLMGQVVVQVVPHKVMVVPLEIRELLVRLEVMVVVVLNMHMEVQEVPDHNIIQDQPVPEEMVSQHFLVHILHMQDVELLVQ